MKAGPDMRAVWLGLMHDACIAARHQWNWTGMLMMCPELQGLASSEGVMGTGQVRALGLTMRTASYGASAQVVRDESCWSRHFERDKDGVCSKWYILSVMFECLA